MLLEKRELEKNCGPEWIKKVTYYGQKADNGLINSAVEKNPLNSCSFITEMSADPGCFMFPLLPCQLRSVFQLVGYLKFSLEKPDVSLSNTASDNQSNKNLFWYVMCLKLKNSWKTPILEKKTILDQLEERVLYNESTLTRNLATKTITFCKTIIRVLLNFPDRCLIWLPQKNLELGINEFQKMVKKGGQDIFNVKFVDNDFFRINHLNSLYLILTMSYAFVTRLSFPFTNDSLEVLIKEVQAQSFLKTSSFNEELDSLEKVKEYLLQTNHDPSAKLDEENPQNQKNYRNSTYIEKYLLVNTLYNSAYSVLSELLKIIEFSLS